MTFEVSGTDIVAFCTVASISAPLIFHVGRMTKRVDVLEAGHKQVFEQLQKLNSTVSEFTGRFSHITVKEV